MATTDEYRQRIQAFDRQGLAHLLARIESRDTPLWDPGKAFEFLVLRAFEMEGADVTWPYVVHLEDAIVEEIDGVVHLPGLSCLVQSKDEMMPVNFEPIAKLRSQLMRRPSAVVGMIVSRAGFTSAAQALVGYLSPQTILLWEGMELEWALKHGRMAEALKVKFRRAVEHGQLCFNICPKE